MLKQIVVVDFFCLFLSFYVRIVLLYLKHTEKESYTRSLTFLKKNQNTPRPSEHPPVMGGEMSKRLGGIKRLQIQNLFMAFKQVSRCR